MSSGQAESDEGSAGPDHLIVGQISKAHGVKGELLVWPLTDTVDTVFAAGRELLLGDTEGELGDSTSTMTVERSRPYKRGVLVKFEEVSDRMLAERLARRYLLAPVEELPPLDEDEVFYHQLLGLEVVTTSGERVGQVREVFDTEPAHLLEVKGTDRLHLIPLISQIVEEIDVDGGRLVIDPLPGLLDL